ncbi:MAG: stage II sporulation protein D [Firmicutes bacterium]|nr:stage II sporulation protein D [Bacillota bacterium]
MRPVVGLFVGIAVVILVMPAIIVGSWKSPAIDPPVPSSDITLQLYVSSSKQLVKIGLEDYVRGVVAAEMPASFHPAALRAQAVAARTYAAKRIRSLGGRGCDAHPQADLCDNPAHCQAWVPVSQLQQKWGMLEYQNYWTKISEAVAMTAREIITYQGIIIDPVFHSTCGGQTEDAGAVWQQSVPYLVPVKCSYCQHSPKLQTEQRYSLTAFVGAMRELDGAITVTAQSLRTTSPNLTIAEKTATGRVSSISIGGRNIKATTLRSALGLNSTRFVHKIEGDQIVFTVQGYGHGVGLCQYGADGMGQAGYDYRAILQYYYQGTQITEIR